MAHRWCFAVLYINSKNVQHPQRGELRRLKSHEISRALECVFRFKLELCYLQNCMDVENHFHKKSL